MMDILRDIGVIARSLDSMANIEFKDLDLTRGQYLYAVRIVENPGIIPDRLADLIKVDRMTASRAINKLEKQRFIEKRSTMFSIAFNHLVTVYFIFMGDDEQTKSIMTKQLIK